jgi:hypothetical protein
LTANFGFLQLSLMADGRWFFGVLDVIFFDVNLLVRWRPVLGVQEIVISVISMLTSPNIDSPANIDASVIYFFPWTAVFGNLGWDLRALEIFDAGPRLGLLKFKKFGFTGNKFFIGSNV